MRKTILKYALALALALGAQQSCAQDTAPDALLKAVTLEVIDVMRGDKDILAGNHAKLAELLESRILPLFDFPRMTQIAAARSWNVATPEQQKALTAEFKSLLVRTYSIALSSYRDQVIEFKPVRGASGETDVTVRSVIRQSGTAPLAMDYDMEHLAAGWKVYDIKIEGVSLVTTYRETFAATFRESGVDGLIKSLAEKNRERDTGVRSNKTGHLYVPVMLVQSLASRLLYIFQ